MSNRWLDNPEKESVKGAALIDKAFQLIDIVGASPGHVGIRQLIRDTGWSRPTLYRILSAITANGFLRLDPVTQAYTLGYRFLELAQNVWSGPDLAAIASIELRRLRDMTGETAYLAVPHDGAMMALGKFEGTHTVRSAARLGIRKPMHCTSQGKAILAFLPPDEVDRLLGHMELEMFTAKTITDLNHLKPHLAIARQRGYAIEDEEIIVGNRCVGAPILDATGKPIAAISVAGPVWRLTSERVEQLGPEVALVARNISAQLRGNADTGPTTDQRHPMAHPASTKPAFYGADPTWDAERKILLWTDRLGPAVFETGSKSSSAHRLPHDAPIQTACRINGAFRIWQPDRQTRMGEGEFRPHESEPDVAAIATAVDPCGVPWVASPEGDGSRIAKVQRAGDAGWLVNGRIAALAWAPNGSTLFAADPEKGTIYSLHPGARTPRIFSRIPRVSGEPRAIAVDQHGRLWVGLYDGWSVARLSEDGEVDSVTALPVPRPTGLAFGGEDMQSLFITSARVGLTREVLDNAPLSGQLLVLRL
ncbi:helix-turn-helix domain-containing protein [Agrobacterium rhizogenes]|uniref:IclR family transcriptional regulator domain-containing protein n=1 Tax=Rhizobium rhizogenes TaxID=359 RepID=UPI001573F9B3|nr:IclR family transcriptional regulator C-terminal domain-containing protein [Rhizobium rhizogenes]NTH16779.1 helix-turn-helix domain-containing protein [Rhizobium rhizogenes]